MTISVVDDVRADADKLKALCVEWGEQRRVDVAVTRYESGESFLADARKTECRVVFMDIYMNGIDGIETARRLREFDSACLLIFLTSSRERMPDAFPCHAFDYLVKPVARIRVFQVLDELEKLLPELQKYIELPMGKQNVRAFLSDIVSAVSEGNYLNIALADEEPLRCRITFSGLCKLLGDDSRFLIVNKGVLVNMDYVDCMQDCACLLQDGSSFPIKVRERSVLERALTEY